MKQKFYDAATLIHNTLCYQTDCFANNHIIKAEQIVAIDDDITSALYAAKLYFETKKTHNFTPRILCVGGKGLMSKYTHQKTEAELLAYVLKSLGVPKDNIIILNQGKNTGENLLAVANQTPPNTTTIWCTTKRLSLRLERTQKQQAPNLISYYYVIEQNIYEVMRLYNGKGLRRGEMLLHELASILNRCEKYSGTFQAPLPFAISPELRNASTLLEQNFRLKLPNKNLKSIFQFIKLYFAIIFYKSKMKEDLESAIKDFKLYEL